MKPENNKDKTKNQPEKLKPISKKEKNKEDKELDKRLKDTFPASDSTAEY